MLQLTTSMITNEWDSELILLNLPTGRMNGFENILLTVQNLVKKLIDSEDINKDVITISSNEKTTKTRTTTTTIYDDDNSSLISLKSHSDEVAVLLSGGVDSSVALKLLLNQGYKVRAFYLKIWLEDELAHLNECPWEEGK